MITEYEIDPRAEGDPLPIETADVGMDLTGHTIHKVIYGLGEIEGVVTVTRAAGTDGPDDVGASSVSWTPTADVIAAAPGRYRVADIIDKDDAATRETIGASWWIVLDLPG